MKTKRFKRFIALAIVCTFLFAFSATTYAADSATTENVASTADIAAPTTVRSINGSKEIPAGGSDTIDVGSLSFPKAMTFTIVTASEASDSYTISWDLMQNGVKVDSGTLGVNSMLEKSIAFAYGTYTLNVRNGATKPTTVFAFFK